MKGKRRDRRNTVVWLLGAALALYRLCSPTEAAADAAGFVRGDADCSRTRPAADVTATLRALGGTSACGNDDCDRDGSTMAADVSCAARCLFGECPIPPAAPLVTSVTPVTAVSIVAFSAVRVTGGN